MNNDFFDKLTLADTRFGADPAAASGAGATGEAVDDPLGAIEAVATERGIDPSYLVGLAKLETRLGNATIKGGGNDTRNLFNVKDFSGGGIRALDKAEGSRDAYRRYESYQDSARDLVGLLERRYPDALRAQTPEDFALALKAGGYATDPQYVSKLTRVIASQGGLRTAPNPAAQPAPSKPDGGDFFDKLNYEQWAADSGQGSPRLMDREIAVEPPQRTAGEAVIDNAIAATTGVYGGIKSISDAFGADNPVSEFSGNVIKTLNSAQSDARQAERQSRQAKIQAAEDSGRTWDEIVANVGSFTDAPIETTLNVLGSSAPTMLAALIPGLGQAGAAGFILRGAVGAAQGTGAVKGSIYEAVQARLKKEGMSESEATKVAAGAQAYDSENAGQIALGSVLGFFAGSSGAEGALSRIVSRKATGEAAGQVARGAAARIGMGVIKEAPLEGAQGGQERVASNIALQNLGYNEPTFKGAVGQGVGEAVASMGPGALGGYFDRPAAPPPNGPLTRALNANSTPPAAPGTTPTPPAAPLPPATPSAGTPGAAPAPSATPGTTAPLASMSDDDLNALVDGIDEADDDAVTDVQWQQYASALEELRRRAAAPAAASPSAVPAVAQAGTPIPAQPATPADAPPAPIYMPGIEINSNRERPKQAKVMQPRQRDSAASVNQMVSNARKLDWLQVSQSPVLGVGAPVVFGDLPQRALVGAAQPVTDMAGNTIPTRYAIVDASDVIASNTIDGSPVREYETGAAGKLRAIAGNGRAASIDHAYALGVAQEKYLPNLLQEANKFGIEVQPQALEAMPRPMLVRIMDEGDVTDNFGAVTNARIGLDRSDVEQATDDARMFDFGQTAFDERGAPTEDSIGRFIQTLPENEAGNLVTKDNRITAQAERRFMAATFKHAYEDDALVQEATMETDPDAKRVLDAVMNASGVMAALKGKGDFDVSLAVADAMKIAINAARKKTKLADEANNQDIAISDEGRMVARFLAQPEVNGSSQRMAAALRTWGKTALNQARIAEENQHQGSLVAPEAMARAAIFAELKVPDGTVDQSVGQRPAADQIQPADIQSQQLAQEQAVKAEAARKRAAAAAAAAAAQADDDRKRIAAASVAAADNFELGQDPLDSLTGQGGLMFSRASGPDTAAQRRATPPSQTADVADADVIVVFNGKEMASAPAPANAPAGAAQDAAQTAPPLRTPIATIRAAITQAYGKLLGQLEAKGLVTLTQTEAQAIEAAAQARADKTGGDVAQIRRWLMAAVKNSLSPMKSIDANILRGLDSLAKALDERTTVHRAMFRNGLGWVDFVWGDTGTVKPSGKTKGAMGLSHIIEARQRKDAMTDGDVDRLMSDIVRAIAVGTEFDRKEMAGAVRAGVELNGTVVWLTRRQGSNAWVVTAYEKNPDGASAGRATLAPTSTTASLTRDGRVAGFESIVGLPGLDIKRSANGALQGFFDPQTGQSFLVADNLTAQAAPGVLIHEVGIHMAADGTMQPLFDRAARLLKAQKANPFMQRVQARLDAAGETSAEEAAAYLTEAYENDRTNAPASVRKWAQDALVAVKAWLHSKGILGADSLTVADIAAVARANAKRMARGDAGGGVKFSRAGAIDQTQTENFKRWFGRSLVREPMTSSKEKLEDKKPLVVYHATGADFSVFEAARPTVNSTTFGDVATKRHGMFFAEDAAFAEGYGKGQGQQVMPVYLKIERPIEMADGIDSEDLAAIVRHSDGDIATSHFDGLNADDLWAVFDGEFGEKFVSAAAKAGFDGAMMTESDPKSGESRYVWVAFSPTQVKSAIGNNGDFDGANQDITFSFSGARAATANTMSPDLARALLALGRPPERATKESVRAAVRELVNGLGALPNSLGRIVVATSAEIRQEWEPLIGAVAMESEDAGRAQGFYDPKSKTVFLIADHIKAGDELGVAAHELMHKHGPAVLGKEGWNQLHGAIGGWAKAKTGSMERIVYDEAARRVQASGPELSNQELFPYAVQVALEMGVRPNAMAPQGTVARWLAQVRNTLRQAWGKITNNPGLFKSQDLVNLAFGIAQRENPAHADQLDGAIHQQDVNDGAGVGVQWSRATGSVPESAAKWLSDAVIADEVEQRIGGFAQQPPIRIRDTAFGQLPGVARNDNVAGAVHDGAIYLFRDQLGDRAAVQRTLFHELLHYGLRKFLTKAQFTEQMLTLYRRDKAIKDEADRWAATADGLRASEFGGSEYALARGADEALAILSEPNGGPHLNQMARAIFVRRVANWLANVAQFLKMDKAAAYLQSIHNSEARAYIKSIFKRLQTEAGGRSVDWSEASEPAFSRAAPRPAPAAATWATPSLEDAKHRFAWDNIVYTLQNKMIDVRRVQQAIAESGAQMQDQQDVYLQEELYHARVSQKSQEFVRQQLDPMVKLLAKNNMELPDFESYLHARHAPEANRVMMERNPTAQDIEDKKDAIYVQLQAMGALLGTAPAKEKKRIERLMVQGARKLELLDSVKPWSGTEEDRQKLSGMSNQEAAAIMAGLTAQQRSDMEDAARLFDAIVKKNRQEMVDYELEDQSTVDGWADMFEFYVPLMREDAGNAQGTGQGFSVKGREVKSRTGSTRKVVDIVANLAMQREKTIVRGEKNRVSQALVGLATANPNPDFWRVGGPDMERKYDPRTGTVKLVANPSYKNLPNVLTAKVRHNGAVKEVAVTFNEDDNRALRMATTLKNLDGQTLEGWYAATAPVTRFLASMSTQYNPIFGFNNLARDLQGAMINLAGTPLANQKGKIAWLAKNAIADIYRASRADRKNQPHQGEWTQWWDMFQEDGGPTGYRDIFQDSAERAKAIANTMNPDAWMESAFGKVATAGGLLKNPMAVAAKGKGFVFDWLSDYNLAMENGVRVSTYRAAVESGMSRERAASLAKNITVNFNRKGQMALKTGALYAFFNAAVQGTARIGQALVTMEPGKPKTMRLSPLGKKVVYGGMMLGALQALALAAAGFDDENPPDFVRERNTIFPIGGGKFITIPMPLGLHVFPGIGRHAVEFMLSGGKDPSKRAIKVMDMMVGAFYPLGSAGMSMQTIVPTVLDPVAALLENRDYAGRPIARESMDKNVPGHDLTRTTATWISQGVAEGINWITGGDKYVAGVMSPTPDQIDYLVGQATGGVGRELLKAVQSGQAAYTGEELPMHKIPLLGRFVGTANGGSSQSSSFYANLNKAKRLDRQIDGLKDDGQTKQAADMERTNTFLLTKARIADKQVTRLRREKRQLLEANAPRSQVQAVEVKMADAMRRFNEATAKP